MACIADVIYRYARARVLIKINNKKRGARGVVIIFLHSMCRRPIPLWQFYDVYSHDSLSLSLSISQSYLLIYLASPQMHIYINIIFSVQLNITQFSRFLIDMKIRIKFKAVLHL